MGRDSHPRERQARALQRKKGTRPPYDRVLIVCEGTKTEPLYFNDIRIQNRFPSAHVEIVSGRYGTQPLQIVNYAHDKFIETRSFEWVFAVFDRDDHTSYHQALSKAAQLDNMLRSDERKRVRFVAVPSVPCFELWILLHFVEIHAHFHRDVIIARLCDHIASYRKGVAGIYGRTWPHLEVAMSRAKKLQSKFNASSGDQPYTNVDVVVTLLKGLRAAT